LRTAVVISCPSVTSNPQPDRHQSYKMLTALSV